MLNKIIQYSLHNRLVVMIASIALLLWGSYTAHKMEVDVFPDLNAPTVVVMTEAQGMAPEEVERMVTFPIETAVNGATDVKSVRSSSTTGFSVVWVQFDWGTNIYTARQIVSEKLSTLGDDDFRVNCRQYFFTGFTDDCRLDNPAPFVIHGWSCTGSRDRW